MAINLGSTFKEIIDEINSKGSGSGGGGGKTKITLAELRSMLANNSTNYGKLIQFVYKGSSTQQIASMINAVGIVQITKQNSLYKKTTSIEMTESAMSGTTYMLSVLYNAAITPFLNYQTWERNFDDGTTVVDYATQFNITDSTFDIYVIGD